MVTICTARLSFSLSIFCSHNIFNFLWGFEKYSKYFTIQKLNELFISKRFHFLKSVDNYMYCQIIIKFSTFCPLNVFLVNVRIWEQTAFIALHNINWLVYITEMSSSNDQWSLYVQKCFHSTFLRSFHTLNICILKNLRTKDEFFPIEL